MNGCSGPGDGKRNRAFLKVFEKIAIFTERLL